MRHQEDLVSKSHKLYSNEALLRVCEVGYMKWGKRDSQSEIEYQMNVERRDV